MINVIPASERISASRQTRQVVTNQLRRAGSLLDSHAVLSFTVLLAIFGVTELGYSLASPLWHDELFTYYIGQASSLRAMFAETQTVDLNPPLSYLLTRVSFYLFGVGTLQSRLPEILGFALALTGVFVFVRRRAGGAFGLLAATMLFGSRAGEVVFQARPYGLLLGTSALALAFWQRACSRERGGGPFAELGLFLSLTALLLTHIFGLFPWAILVLGEMTHSLRARNFSVVRSLALLCPTIAIGVYGPLLRNHARSSFPAAFQPGGIDIFLFYMGHVDRELITLSLAALLVALVAGRSWLRGSPAFALTMAEWVVTLGLLAAPLFLIAELMLTHAAFFDRYGAIACLGTAVLFTTLFCFWSGGCAGAAVIAIAISLLVTQRFPDAVTTLTQGQVLRHTEPHVTPLPTRLMTDATLPLVAASGLTFLEMQAREPRDLLRRTYFLIDRRAAMDEAHATIFEGMTQEAAIFPVQGHVEAYTSFVSSNHAFYVLGTYDYPEDWLLRELQADGALLTVLGRVQGSYKDHELYLVTMPRAQRLGPGDLVK